MSGLNQKIQEKAKTINELEKILYQKSRYTSREFIYEKDKRETWVTVDYVTALLDEATKQIRKDLENRLLNYIHSCGYYLGDQKRDRQNIKAILNDVLGVDGKEKAKP